MSQPKCDHGNIPLVQEIHGRSDAACEALPFFSEGRDTFLRRFLYAERPTSEARPNSWHFPWPSERPALSDRWVFPQATRTGVLPRLIAMECLGPCALSQGSGHAPLHLTGHPVVAAWSALSSATQFAPRPAAKADLASPAT